MDKSKEVKSIISAIESKLDVETRNKIQTELQRLAFLSGQLEVLENNLSYGVKE